MKDDVKRPRVKNFEYILKFYFLNVFIFYLIEGLNIGL